MLMKRTRFGMKYLAILNTSIFFYFSENNMVIGLRNIKFSKGVCQGCILGKHPENKYERASHERTSAPLELIHNEISGPFHHMSMSQAKYEITFIDDFSRYCWVHFLKHKSEVFYLFKVFRALLKTSLGGNTRSSDMKMVVSMSILSSFSIAKMQLFRCNIQSLTHCY